MQHARDLAANRKESHMVDKPQAHNPRSLKESPIGFEKTKLGNENTRKAIKRILAKRAKRTETGKPQHQP
jgi:hypothetical protein